MTKYIINKCQAYKQYSGEGFILSGSEHPSSRGRQSLGKQLLPLFLAAQALAHDLSSETLPRPEMRSKWPRGGDVRLLLWEGRVVVWVQAAGQHGVVLLTGCGPRQGSNACRGQCALHISFIADFGACLACRPQHDSPVLPGTPLCYPQILSINSLFAY